MHVIQNFYKPKHWLISLVLEPFIVPLKADPQAPAFLVSIMMMIIHSYQLRMLDQMTMLRGQQVLKNAQIQLKLGVGRDGPSHF
jgi:hypothetical protein